VPGVRLAPEMDELLRTHLHSSVHGDVTSKRWTQDAAFPLSLPSNHTAFNGMLVSCYCGVENTLVFIGLAWSFSGYIFKT